MSTLIVVDDNSIDNRDDTMRECNRNDFELLTVAEIAIHNINVSIPINAVKCASLSTSALNDIMTMREIMLKRINIIKVPEFDVVYSWVRDETSDPNHQYAHHYKRLLEENPLNPDREGFIEAVYNIFNFVRGKYTLWTPIAGTRWYRATIDVNSLNIVAPWKFEPRDGYEKSNLDNIILWGHNPFGPFVVIEGNHRWHNRASTTGPLLATVFIGLSCCKYWVHATTDCRICGKTDYPLST